MEINWFHQLQSQGFHTGTSYKDLNALLDSFTYISD